MQDDCIDFTEYVNNQELSVQQIKHFCLFCCKHHKSVVSFCHYLFFNKKRETRELRFYMYYLLVNLIALQSLCHVMIATVKFSTIYGTYTFKQHYIQT